LTLKIDKKIIVPQFPEKSVAILMATYNGELYLRDQLNSLHDQTHKNWQLIVSDDGSTDNTLEILQEYQKAWGETKLVIRSGPQRGYCKNFLSLACDPKILADYYAFCDQDDVWLPAKIEVALAYHEGVSSSHVPQMYCGRTIYVKSDLKPYACSPKFTFPRTFRNALIQSIAGGNTMVFNNSTKNLLNMTGVVDHPSHDWWIYQLVTGSGGVVYYDPHPQILYRQHPNSVVGENKSVLSRMIRLRLLLNGQFRRWTDQCVVCLKLCSDHLTDESKSILELFERMRNTTLKNRFRLLEVCGLYRQTWRGSISMIIASLLNKI
jgi:glycosyltransferase involved in cell wall biosynthesis